MTLSRGINVKMRLFGAAIIKSFYGLIVNATLYWEHLAHPLHTAHSIKRHPSPSGIEYVSIKKASLHQRRRKKSHKRTVHMQDKRNEFF